MMNGLWKSLPGTWAVLWLDIFWVPLLLLLLLFYMLRIGTRSVPRLINGFFCHLWHRRGKKERVVMKVYETAARWSGCLSWNDWTFSNFLRPARLFSRDVYRVNELVWGFQLHLKSQNTHRKKAWKSSWVNKKKVMLVWHIHFGSFGTKKRDGVVNFSVVLWMFWTGDAAANYFEEVWPWLDRLILANPQRLKRSLGQMLQ